MKVVEEEKIERLDVSQDASMKKRTDMTHMPSRTEERVSRRDGNLTGREQRVRSPYDDGVCVEDHIERAKIGRRRRGIPRRRGKFTASERFEKPGGSHYSKSDASGLSKAWIIVSGRCIKSEDKMWSQIDQIFRNRFQMHRTRESLPAKWDTMQRESFIWISCRFRVECDEGMGN